MCACVWRVVSVCLCAWVWRVVWCWDAWVHMCCTQQQAIHTRVTHRPLCNHTKVRNPRAAHDHQCLDGGVALPPCLRAVGGGVAGRGGLGRMLLLAGGDALAVRTRTGTRTNTRTGARTGARTGTGTGTRTMRARTCTRTAATAASCACVRVGHPLPAAATTRAPPFRTTPLPPPLRLLPVAGHGAAHSSARVHVCDAQSPCPGTGVTGTATGGGGNNEGTVANNGGTHNTPGDCCTHVGATLIAALQLQLVELVDEQKAAKAKDNLMGAAAKPSVV